MIAADTYATTNHSDSVTWPNGSSQTKLGHFNAHRQRVRKLNQGDVGRDTRRLDVELWMSLNLGKSNKLPFVLCVPVLHFLITARLYAVPCRQQQISCNSSRRAESIAWSNDTDHRSRQLVSGYRGAADDCMSLTRDHQKAAERSDKKSHRYLRQFRPLKNQPA